MRTADRSLSLATIVAIPLCVVCASAVLTWPSLAGEPRFERMAALQETIVSVHERAGIPGVFTYNHDPTYWLGNVALGKLKVGVSGASGVSWLADSKDLKVRNTTGGEGVEASGGAGGVRVKVEALPTAAGRGTMRWEGSALIKVTAWPPSQLVFEFGGIGLVRTIPLGPEVPSRPDYLMQGRIESSAGDGTECRADASGGILGAKGVPSMTAVHFSSKTPVALESANGVLRCSTKGPASIVYALVAFAEDEARAAELAAAKPEAVEQECRKRFTDLAQAAWIETPSKVLDEAFLAAARNLEYAWVRPYGWIEAIHHWGTLYTQQHSLAADWIGQADRSREMLLTHASKLLPSGQVPQLDPYGRTRQDFGGWSQFYVWGVQHYWRHTGDRGFLDKIREPLGRVVGQTFEAHDADGNGLLGFGQQIGNQEDYISTPEDGTSPTIAGIEMKRIQAELALAVGRKAEAEVHALQARRMAESLRESLWDTGLGRYTFYRDALGVHHLDGQYHTLIWPVILDLLGPPGSYTSMRHLADTLTGQDGQIYASNNFPNHVVATVGSQAGGQQQPWATLGWTKLGDGDRAIRPLEWIAERVMNEANAGSWCEVAEDMPAYFTPPAGVYIQGIVEGVFGLTLDKPAGVLRVSPCLPDRWPKARLHLPEYDVTVAQSSTYRKIECSSTLSLRHVYRVQIPPSREVRVRGNGKSVGFRLEEGIRRQFVCVDLPPCERSSLEIRWQAVKRAVTCPPEASPGRWFAVTVAGGRVERVSDPCGVLSDWRISGPRISLRIREGVAADAGLYGEPGRRTLTRRSVFAYVRLGARSGYWEPIDFAVVPALRFAQGPVLVPAAGGLRLTFEVAGLRQGKSLPASVEFGGVHKRVAPSPRGLSSVALEDRDLAAIHPGLNELTIVLDDGRTLTGRFDGSPLFSAWDDFRAYAAARIRRVPLPAEVLSPDTEWRNWRWWSAYGHQPWASLPPPLQGLDGKADLSPPSCPGLSFANPGRKLAVVSRHIGRPVLTLPVEQQARKVYLLLLPLLDNHDVFSPVGRITVRCGDGTAFERTLRIPGDLDWWGPRAILGGFATVGAGWTDSPVWETPSCVVNVIAVDLREMRPVESVTVETIGRYPALGVVGLTTLGQVNSDDVARLPGRVRALAEREPRAIFAFDLPTLSGWETTGAAWGIGDATTDYWGRRGSGRYFANSMAGGESAIGTITSPMFRITGSKLVFLANGHGNRNYYALVDAGTGAELLRAPAPEKTGPFAKVVWDVSRLRGREVRFKAVDEENGSAYAWIAFDDVLIER